MNTTNTTDTAMVIVSMGIIMFVLLKMAGVI